MLFVSHDLMTYIRSNWRWKFTSWFDHYFVIHRFSAYLVTYYAMIHSACHLFGTFRIIVDSDLENINSHLLYYKFNEKPSYLQILFTTLPGLTGVMLLVIILLMATTSMRCVRMKRFQLFGYVHMALFPVFLALLLIHGWGLWFSFWIPLATLLVTPGFIMLIVQEVMKMCSGLIYNFEILDVSVTWDCSYIMIYFSKPKNYKLVHGQYVFLNVPEINQLQWHPFTVASSPSSPYLILMIKRAGDWTGKLIRALYQHKK